MTRVLRSGDIVELLAAARGGDRRAIARLFTLVERGGETASAVASRVTSSSSGETYTVGVTGAPGAGKSTLTSALIGQLRRSDVEVGVLAIDPTSPFSGGAILGDRVRMQPHATDPGVFIRSMATRGQLGGLATAVPDAVRVFAGIGTPWVIVETVGVGQVEVEIAQLADTTVVVVNPGWGDSVQANKAGLLEIADVFVVNKADRPGADQTKRDLEQMLDLGDRPQTAWRPPIVSTSATDGLGVSELWDLVERHRAYVTESGRLELHRAESAAAQLDQLYTAQTQRAAESLVDPADRTEIELLVRSGKLSVWEACERLIRPLLEAVEAKHVQHQCTDVLNVQFDRARQV